MLAGYARDSICCNALPWPEVILLSLPALPLAFGCLKLVYSIFQTIYRLSIVHFGQFLQLPIWCVPHGRHSGSQFNAFPFRNQESTIRMCFLAQLVAVLMAQCVLNFFQGLYSGAARLTIPEHDEALSAHAAACFGMASRSLAENLHTN